METAKIFKNGNSQAVRLPREYAFEGSEVLIRRVGRAVVLLPKDDPWADFWASLDLFPADFIEVREQPELQEREPF